MAGVSSEKLMDCLELSKDDIDTHLTYVKDLVNSLINNNISNMSDDEAAVLFINSTLDLFDTSSHPSMRTYLMKNAKDDISMMMPSLKKALANKAPLENKLHVGGQRHLIFNVAYLFTMILVMVRLVYPAAQRVINRAEEGGVHHQIAVTLGAAVILALMAPFVLLERRIHMYLAEDDFIAGPRANPFGRRPTLEDARFIGYLNVKSTASLGQPHNAYTFDDFEDGDAVVLLERRRGREVSRNATNINWPFIFKRGAEGEGIEQMFRNGRRWPTNPLSRRELQQANVERATLRIRPHAKEGLRAPGENSIPNNGDAANGLRQRLLGPRRGGRSTRRRKN